MNIIAFLNNFDRDFLVNHLNLSCKTCPLKSRFFIRLSFLGTNYHGWQAQKNSGSVQTVLNESLSVILKERITCTGAGRTDAGVHAKVFFAHFDTSRIIEAEQVKHLVYHLNGYLPADIAIHDIFPVQADSNARFSAVSRTYQYLVCQSKDPFLIGYSYPFTLPLDIHAMNQGADIIRTYSDFTSFAKLPSETKTNICHIKEIFWERKGHILIFTVTADRFLRNMVRAIVGTLIDLGRGKTGLDDIRRIIESKNRSAAGTSVPACGLYLTSVLYPDTVFITME